MRRLTKPNGKLFETISILVALYRFSFSVTKDLSHLAYISESYPEGYFEIPHHFLLESR